LINIGMNNANQSLESTIALLQEALKEIAETKQPQSINFQAAKGDTNYGKGITWSGQGPLRQFVFSKPDGFLSTEDIVLDRNKSYKINGDTVLSQNELGQAVTKSHLTEVGRLKGLIVDGSVSINQHVYYDARNKKLGLGTETPKDLFTIASNGIELGLGVVNNKSYIGTSSELNLCSLNIPRISIERNGDIKLGNTEQPPVQVSVHGKLSIKVSNPDPNVDLHVSGPVRLHGRLYTNGDSYPTSGVNHLGDIVWNSNPTPGKPIGWVCVRAGNPGTWAQFGLISHLG